MQLFLKDREDDVNNNILPSLENKKLIILDRYYFSNAAYQGAMGISPGYIINENQKRKFPEPDRIFLLDIDPELALHRINKRNNNTQTEIFEKMDFLKKVNGIYHSIADNRFVFLDGTKEIETELIFSAMAERIMYFPLKTISKSETGLECIYQGSSILPMWRLELNIGNEFNFNIKWSVI